MGNNGTCPICGGSLITLSNEYACDTCSYRIYDDTGAVYHDNGIEINIKRVKKLPANVDWDYSIEEIDYLIDQIKNGDRENGCTMLLFEGRLYEKQEV